MKNFLFEIIKLVFYSTLFLGGFVGIMILTSHIFDNLEYALYSIWLYLGCIFLGYIYIKHKKSFTEANLKNILEKIRSIIKGLFKFFWYFLLALIGIVILFMIGGWILSLSAMSIIIILLILILLKK